MPKTNFPSRILRALNVLRGESFFVLIFTSIEFYLFLSVTFAAWRLTPQTRRVWTLLAASYLFCAWWQPWFALVLLYCTLVSYIAGILISNTGYQRSVVSSQMSEKTTDETPARFAHSGREDRQDGPPRNVFSLAGRCPISLVRFSYPLRLHGSISFGILGTAVVLNLLPLLFFKYFNFFNESLREILTWGRLSYAVPHLDLLLPVGISFYTFQAMSYCADVHGRRIEAERNPAVFGLYLSFFPRLVSGPIERGKNLLPQLRRIGGVDKTLLASGVRLFFWGVFKKIVIADRLGMYVDMVFSDPARSYGWTAILGVWMFSLQIYCDFSAYMDMAIGCGRIFGIELSNNFNYPYMARSIGEFWRCWHITLTTWFRDYVYIPLGGNRLEARRWALNVMAVFLLSGLWHGAAWTFVFWGGLHGFYYLAGRYSAPLRRRLRRRLGLTGYAEAVWQVIVTFNLVTLAWVFFRAKRIEDAFGLIGNMVVHLDRPVRMLASQFSTALAFLFALVFVGAELVQYCVARRNVDLVAAVPPVIRYSGYALGLLVACLLGVNSHQFIYFQF